MAIIDAFNEFSVSQVETATAVGTNTIDTNATNDVGVGEEIVVEFTVDVDFAGGTSLRCDIVDDDNAALSSPTVLASSAVILTAALLAGRDPIRVTLPAGAQTQRYLGVQYTIVGTMSGGGAISAYVVQGEQSSQGNLVDHGAN